MAPRTPTDLAIRKKMRKGTHSCFECRRRKIRCIFPPDNPNECTECFARGSRCIDQEHASADAIVDHRKNLRERVSRLESLVDSLMDEKSDRGAAETLRNLRGEFPVSPQSSEARSSSVADQSDRGPSLRPYDSDVITRSAEDPSVQEAMRVRSVDHTIRFTPISAHENTVVEISCDCREDGDYANMDRSPAAQAKLQETTRTLLGAFPPNDQLEKLLQDCERDWLFFRIKCPGTTGIKMGMAEFAKYAFKLGHPASIAVILLFIGSVKERADIDRYLALVDRWVLSDEEYSCSLEGLECLIVSARIYADIGQPRRAWLSFRRGLMFAQLMGLHRNHISNLARDSIWWTLYQTDRFLSLLLGLPYGVPDTHCDLRINESWSGMDKAKHQLNIKIAEVAGRVIDRVHGEREQNYPSALEIDQELEKLANQAPKEWWDTSLPPVDEYHHARMHERLATQFTYHQTRVYLHLSFMLRSANDPRYVFSRDTCFNAAREMLKVYHQMRHGSDQPFFEGKAIDFIGFHGTMVIMLNLLGYCDSSSMRDANHDHSDCLLVRSTMDVFRRASTEKGGRVAAQSLKVLEELVGLKNKDITYSEKQKIAIPYFGTITIYPSKVKTAAANLPYSPPPSDCSQYSPPQQNETNQVFSDISSQTNDAATATRKHQTQDQFIRYDGIYLPDAPPQYDANQQQHHQNYAGDPVLSGGIHPPTAHWSAANMDIDQDWSWFLNDPHQIQTLS